MELAVYSEAVYGFLDSAAVPNVIPDKLANKLRLEISLTESHAIFAHGNSESLVGSVSGIPVSFGSIVMRLYFSIISSVPYDFDYRCTKVSKDACMH